MKRFRLGPTSLTTTLAVLTILFGAGFASQGHAQSCPQDLSSLAPQIQEPDLQALLSTPVDTLVAQAGSLSQIIADVETHIANLTDAQANMGNATDPAVQQYTADALLVLNAELSALMCRQGS